jgi:hypothetical protein
MEQRIEVRPMGPGEYAATVTEGQDSTHHRLVMSESVLDALALVEPDDRVRAALARETLAFLLDRDPADAIPHDLDLDSIADRFPDYLPELRSRLGLPAG